MFSVQSVQSALLTGVVDTIKTGSTSPFHPVFR
jgi:hypothetical protein